MFRVQRAPGRAGLASSPWTAGIGFGGEIEGAHASQRFDNGKPSGMHAPDQAMSAQDAVPLRILLVDDNEDAVRSVEQLLDYLGYAVKGVTHGREALAVGAAFAPDVVLLDLGMPDMSGYEIAAAIRAQTWGARVRIVALTGWGEPEDIRRSMDAGFEAHLVKPLKLHELQDILARRME